jgi:hypothetical protein
VLSSGQARSVSTGQRPDGGQTDRDPTQLRNHPRSFWPLPEHTRWLQDCFYQRMRRISEERFERAAGPMLRLLLEVGGVFAIEMGCTPFADKCMAENKAAIDAALLAHGQGLTAELWCGTSDDDGQLYAPEETTLAYEPLGAGKPAFTCPVRVAIPIEIGDTMPDVTARHLFRWQATARWPYGHDKMYVLACDPARCPDLLDQATRWLLDPSRLITGFAARSVRP